jgi:hypothetical protein
MRTPTLPRHARTGLTAIGWRKPRTGEDPTTLHPIWPILGAAEDDDEADGDESDESDDSGDEADGEGDDADTSDGQDDSDDDTGDTDPAGADQLGDAGKRALDAMKAKWRTERERRKAAETKAAALEARPAGDESDPEQIRAEADKAATARANQRIIRSEVRAAAAGKFNDPKDALVYLDITQFEVDEDGQVDEDEIADAIETLLKSKPYLGVAATPPEPRFKGTGDGGARKGSAGPKQLTEQDVKRMTPEQIDEAHRKGQLRDYLGA